MEKAKNIIAIGEIDHFQLGKISRNGEEEGKMEKDFLRVVWDGIIMHCLHMLVTTKDIRDKLKKNGKENLQNTV